MRRSFNGSYPITRPYGVVDPAYSNYPGSKHPGTDYATPANTPLVAGMSGTVTVYNRDPSIRVGRGKEVVITNGTTQRKVCHLNRIDVVNGQKVVEGQQIALSGNTGYVLPQPTPTSPNAGAHLHDELLLNGVYVDLEKNLNNGGTDMTTNRDEALWLARLLRYDHTPDESWIKDFTGKDLMALLVDAYNDQWHIDNRNAIRGYAALKLEIEKLKADLAAGTNKASALKYITEHLS